MSETPAPAAQAPTETALSQARAAGLAEGRTAERARVAAILQSPEAEGRMALACELALSTDLEAEPARKVLAKAPIIDANKIGGSATTQLYAAVAATGGTPKLGQLDEQPSTKPAGKRFGNLADGMRAKFQPQGSA